MLCIIFGEFVKLLPLKTPDRSCEYFAGPLRPLSMSVSIFQDLTPPLVADMLCDPSLSLGHEGMVKEDSRKHAAMINILEANLR